MSDLIPNPDGSSERRTRFPSAPPMVIVPIEVTISAEYVFAGSMTMGGADGNLVRRSLEPSGLGIRSDIEVSSATRIGW